jgi:hypothetical protein
MTGVSDARLMHLAEQSGLLKHEGYLTYKIICGPSRHLSVGSDTEWAVVLKSRAKARPRRPFTKQPDLWRMGGFPRKKDAIDMLRELLRCFPQFNYRVKKS